MSPAKSTVRLITLARLEFDHLAGRISELTQKLDVNSQIRERLLVERRELEDLQTSIMKMLASYGEQDAQVDERPAARTVMKFTADEHDRIIKQILDLIEKAGPDGARGNEIAAQLGLREHVFRRLIREQAAAGNVHASGGSTHARRWHLADSAPAPAPADRQTPPAMASTPGLRPLQGRQLREAIIRRLGEQPCTVDEIAVALDSARIDVTTVLNNLLAHMPALRYNERGDWWIRRDETSRAS